jgi:hypothetical protein
MEPTEAPEAREVPALHPLTPEYMPSNHAVYFNAMKDALGWTGDKKVRNVALTGSYGVGKSSILRQVAEDKTLKAIQVSLSTLGFQPAADASKGSDSDENADGAENPLRDTKTNQIQKEIVKQLLYTQMPDRMPGSRYRRTAAFNWPREILIALASGIPLAIVVFLFGWTAKLATLLTIRADWAIAANGGMAVVAAGLVLGLRFLTHNKLRIDSVSTGAATITLSAKTDTYFDEYLDEIVYFFQVVDADIVIFEDIDRFEDPHIFETLRELNTILNAAKQLNGRTIRFIYAIRDSIFEELGVRAAREADGDQPDVKKLTTDAAILEVARANRTKFFDLVIPVVPFVTHQSARELMSTELNDVEEHKVSDDLIDLVAQHVADMRLIRNIRNEFVIFKEHVIRKSSLELSDDHLFAMVLYKSTHLSDFERIKLGTSNLDTLYKESRSLVQNNSTRLNSELVQLRRRRRSVGDQSQRAKVVGTAVEAYIELFVSHMGGDLVDIRFDSAVIPATDLHDDAFWRKYAAGNAPLAFVFYDRFRGNRVIDLSREELHRATGYSLDPAAWERASVTDVDQKIVETQVEIEFFSRADLQQLYERPDVEVSVGDTRMAFSTRVSTLLGSKLATDLVGGGFIDRYFTLYTSTFPGEKVNANAMNFILKNVDTGSVDFYFTLSADEARAVIHERPRLAIGGKSAYNLDLVDYLLTEARAKDALSAVVKNLTRYGDDEKRFLQAYLPSEHNAVELAHAMAKSWPNVLVAVIDELEVDESRRLQLVDAALRGIDPEIEYAVSGTVSAYLVANYAELESFTGTIANPDAIGRLVGACEVDLPDLRLLSAPIRRTVVPTERFVVNRDNMLAATSPSTDLALGALKADHGSVYNRAIRSLGDYLNALTSSEDALSDVASFAGVITDIDKVDRAALTAVIGRSPTECRVVDITGVPAGTWPALAVNDRFPAEFANVAAYGEYYGVDTNLATVLSGNSIATPADADESVKLALALQIARAREVIPSSESRALLMESLHLENHISADAIPAERGEWIGRLIQQGLIEDSEESFGLVASDDWDGLEYAIRASEEFSAFIGPSIVTPRVMIRFLESSELASSLKDAVVTRFVEFSDGADRATVNRMLRYALDSGTALEWNAVERAARAHADNSLVLREVQRFNSAVTLEHMRPVLTAMGGVYAQLLERNGLHPKFPDTPENRALLNRMYELGTVSTIDDRGSKLQAHMRRPD